MFYLSYTLLRGYSLRLPKKSLASCIIRAFKNHRVDLPALRQWPVKLTELLRENLIAPKNLRKLVRRGVRKWIGAADNIDTHWRFVWKLREEFLQLAHRKGFVSESLSNLLCLFHVSFISLPCETVKNFFKNSSDTNSYVFC